MLHTVNHRATHFYHVALFYFYQPSIHSIS
jgi:hypothetical protein